MRIEAYSQVAKVYGANQTVGRRARQRRRQDVMKSRFPHLVMIIRLQSRQSQTLPI